MAKNECEWCADGLQADGETPCPCQITGTFPNEPAPTWSYPDLIPRSEAERMAQKARGAALKYAAAECVFVDGISGDERWQEPRAIQRAILSLDPDAVIAHDAAIREAVQTYRIALADAIRRPMGVVPASAEGLVTTAELDAAEERRAAIRARGET